MDRNSKKVLALQLIERLQYELDASQVKLFASEDALAAAVRQIRNLEHQICECKRIRHGLLAVIAKLSIYVPRLAFKKQRGHISHSKLLANP